MRELRGVEVLNIQWTKVPYTDWIDGVNLVQSSLSCCIINHARANEELYMGILDELLGGGQRRKSTAISLIDTNKGSRPRATPIKRFSSAIVMCHTPCRLTSTLRRR